VEKRPTKTALPTPEQIIDSLHFMECNVEKFVGLVLLGVARYALTGGAWGGGSRLICPAGSSGTRYGVVGAGGH